MLELRLRKESATELFEKLETFRARKRRAPDPKLLALLHWLAWLCSLRSEGAAAPPSDSRMVCRKVLFGFCEGGKGAHASAMGALEGWKSSWGALLKG